jgi:hypothetical protein
VNDRALSELFVAIADYANARGVKGPGFLEFDGPEGLRCQLNATPKEQHAVPPYSCALLARGMPLGIVDPYGGALAYVGDWTEDKLIRVFKAGAAA